jgi:choline dehydrogenase
MVQDNNTAETSGEGLSRRELLKRSAGYVAGIAALASGASGAVAPQEFEYIVVGSGPGGGPLACNLARAGHTVCLIEAGSPGTDADLQPLIKVPVFFSSATADPRIAWEYFVRHYADNVQQMKDSKYVASEGGILYPRCSTIGGCSVHNVLVMMYPSNSDWEYIVNLTGDQSWAPDLMRNYFQRLEQCRYETPPFGVADTARHGFDGWQPTELGDPTLFNADPQVQRMLQAAQTVMGQAGDVNAWLENKLDPNDYTVIQNDQQGLYAIPLSRLDGARWSVRDRILETAAEFPNLTIMTNTLVTKVLMEGDTATGVEIMQGEYLYRASPMAESPDPTTPPTGQINATREVIISGGTFNSPQILKLSGIGDSAELSKLGIRTLIESPGVGVGMMDRYEVSVVTQLKSPFTLFNSCVPGSPTDPCYGSWLQGQGIYTTNLTAITSIRKSDPARPDRDLLVVLATGPFHGYYPGWQLSVINPTQFSWLLLKAHTQNTAGTVMLQTNDPRDVPIIDFHYFQEGNDTAGDDLASVVDGIQLARQVNAQIADLAVGEVYPGPSVQTASDIASFVQNEAWGHHASCSNRMGATTDPMAVVDSNFKVIGTRNLRVVDASVFPRIPGYYPMIAIMMISEKASDVILAAADSQPAPPPARLPERGRR